MNEAVKKQISEAINHWINPLNPERTALKLKSLSGVNEAYISQIKAGKFSQGDTSFKPEVFHKLAAAIGFNIDKYDFHWETPSYTALWATCEKMQRQRRICSVDSRESGATKTYTLKRYATLVEKVTYMKCTHTMKVKDFLDEIIKSLRIHTEVKSAKQKIDAIKNYLSDNRGWLFIIDETDDIPLSLWKVIKEIYDALQGLCGLVICGMGTHMKISKYADKSRDGFKQIKRRLFSYKVMLPGLTHSDVDYICKQHDITDKEANAWLKNNVHDYQMMVEYLRDALEVAETESKSINKSLLIELFG